MRRIVVIFLSLLALGAPMVAAAASRVPGDGTLVVRNADNGDGISGRPAVTLVIRGSVIGHVSESGRIAIYDLDPTDSSTPEVTGASWHRDVSDIGTMWRGLDFRFRAIDGTFKVQIWGSGVDLFAIGHGTVTLTGQEDTPRGDGQFSLNGGDFRSIPYEASKTIAAAPGA